MASFYYLSGERMNYLYGAESITVNNGTATGYSTDNLFDGLPGYAWLANSAASALTITADLQRALNGGFETWTLSTVPDYWTDDSVSGGALSENTTDEREGTSCLELTPGGGTAEGSQIINLPSGATYQFYGYLKGNGTAGVQARIQNLDTGNYLNSSGSWVAAASDWLGQTAASWQDKTTTVAIEAFSVTLKDVCRIKVSIRSTGGTLCRADAFRVHPQVDFVSIHGHNFPTTGTLKLRSSTDNASWTDRATLTVARPSFWDTLASPINARYWRIEKSETQTDAAMIGQLVLSSKKTLTRTHLVGGGTHGLTRRMPAAIAVSQSGQIYQTNLSGDAPTIRDLAFMGPKSDYEEAETNLYVRSGWGQFPVVIVPDSTDKARVHFGRVEVELAGQRPYEDLYRWAVRVEEFPFFKSLSE